MGQRVPEILSPPSAKYIKPFVLLTFKKVCYTLSILTNGKNMDLKTFKDQCYNDIVRPLYDKISSVDSVFVCDLTGAYEVSNEFHVCYTISNRLEGTNIILGFSYYGASNTSTFRFRIRDRVAGNTKAVVIGSEKLSSYMSRYNTFVQKRNGIIDTISNKTRYTGIN